ncbi:MAG: lipoprotein [Lachnospiraceae bacterium]|jgi:hypothetical protein
MFKKILVVLVALSFIFSLAACCNGEKQPDPSQPASQSESAEPEQSVPAPDTEQGVPAPDGWPKDIPTPVKGEIVAGGWIESFFYTTDIIYEQEDIDAYCKRLESFGFAKQEEHEYGEDWPDAIAVYSNGHWDVIVAGKNEVFNYSYVNFYPLFNAIGDGYNGQPEGWPDAGEFTNF